MPRGRLLNSLFQFCFEKELLVLGRMGLNKEIQKDPNSMILNWSQALLLLLFSELLY